MNREFLKPSEAMTQAPTSESPLAWLVFCEKHPEGFDYMVFPFEHDADAYACEQEIDKDQIVPLYRASAFTQSASVPANKTLAEKIRAYGDAMFDCGQWDEEDGEGYSVVHKRAKDAEAALIAALPSAEADSECDAIRALARRSQ